MNSIGAMKFQVAYWPISTLRVHILTKVKGQEHDTPRSIRFAMQGYFKRVSNDFYCGDLDNSRKLTEETETNCHIL